MIQTELFLAHAADDVDYRLIRSQNCFIMVAAQPGAGIPVSTGLEDLMKLAPKAAVMDLQAAWILDANMVVGTEDALWDLKRTAGYAKAAEAKVEACFKGAVVAPTPELRQWLAYGSTGLSSRYLVGILSQAPALVASAQVRGADPSHVPIPHDPSDFHRCVMALDAAPNLRRRFNAVAQTHDAWAAIVAEWDVLVALLRYAQMPSDRTGTGDPEAAVQLHERLRAIEAAARASR